MNKQVKKPNVVRGGIAIPLGRNYYYMAGRKHKNGGIDIGKNPRTGLEVEDGEVMHISDKNVKVFSSVPFLNGKSPAQKVLGGENPDTVFKQQESFKDRNKINDDGSRKKAQRGIKRKGTNLTAKEDYDVNFPFFLRWLDPTGISSYPDAHESLKKNKKDITLSDVFQVTSAIPAIGRIGKLLSVMSNIGSIRDDYKQYKEAKDKYDNEEVMSYNGYVGPRKIIKSHYTPSQPLPGQRPVVTSDTYKRSDGKVTRVQYKTGGLSTSKDYKSKSKSYSKEGGIYSVTVNGKTKMRMLPSTGGRTKAELGTIATKDELKRMTEKMNEQYTDYLNELKTINIDDIINSNKVSKINVTPFTTSLGLSRYNNAKANPFKMTKGDTISLASNIGGSLISAGINALALKNLKAPSRPISAPAAKLKTHININPQLDRMRETVAEYERNVDNNTLSSRVALARKQNARLNSILQTNELYGAKENAETELINKDKINRQTVAAENVKAYNDWRDRVNAFENEIVDKKSENLVSMIGDINQGLQDVISRNEQRDAERQTRLAMSAAHPNVNPRILKALGIKGITDEDIARWEKAFYNKK